MLEQESLNPVCNMIYTVNLIDLVWHIRYSDSLKFHLTIPDKEHYSLKTDQRYKIALTTKDKKTMHT